VSPRTRIWLVVGAIAIVAAGATVGATLLTRTGTGGSTAAAVVPKQKGAPELDLDLGIRTDAEAVALRRALALYDQGHRTQAERTFARYRSLEARVGAAMSAWPNGFDRLAALERQHPRSSLAQLELGLAFFWQGRLGQAQAAWRAARKAQPNTYYAIRAEDLLYPKDAPGLPPFSPSFTLPSEIAQKPFATQLAYLAAHARSGGAHDRLLYGVALQSLHRPVAAEREFAQAAALAPHDPDAQVAAAVGLFDKGNPSIAFAKLGPLVRVFPKAATVRFHLGLLLIWIGQFKAARPQLERVVVAGPSPFLADAKLLLSKLGGK
jgi:tetratricopeptide (TPR) repeat protein